MKATHNPKRRKFMMNMLLYKERRNKVLVWEERIPSFCLLAFPSVSAFSSWRLSHVLHIGPGLCLDVDLWYPHSFNLPGGIFLIYLKVPKDEFHMWIIDTKWNGKQGNIMLQDNTSNLTSPPFTLAFFRVHITESGFDKLIGFSFWWREWSCSLFVIGISTISSLLWSYNCFIVVIVMIYLQKLLTLKL